MISVQVLLTFVLLWGITHAWQYGGERNWAGFANTELYFYLNCARLLSIFGFALSFLAVVWFSGSIFLDFFNTCSI